MTTCCGFIVQYPLFIDAFLVFIGYEGIIGYFTFIKTIET